MRLGDLVTTVIREPKPYSLLTSSTAFPVMTPPTLVSVASSMMNSVLAIDRVSTLFQRPRVVRTTADAPQLDDGTRRERERQLHWATAGNRDLTLPDQVTVNCL